MTTYTPKLLLPLPAFDSTLWQDQYYQAMRIIDAAIGLFTSLPGFRGIWTNSTAYAVDDMALDSASAQIYVSRVAHTSASSGTFADARTANPEYWRIFNPAAANRGDWTPSTAYLVNDFVLAQGSTGSVYAVCAIAHTSGAVFADDLAAGYWDVLIDFGASLTWGGTQDFTGATLNVDTPATDDEAANKLYVDNAIATITTLLTGYALLSGATFTGIVKGITPVSPEDLTTKEYVDAAAFEGALPGQVGNAGLSVTTDGTTTGARWGLAFTFDQYRNAGGVM